MSALASRPGTMASARWDLLRRLGRWLFRLRGSPEAIALGVAIGVFVAFTPTAGIQALVALLLATVLGANRPAAVAPVFLTNPLTALPAFTLTYRAGLLLVPGPSQGEARELLAHLVASLTAHGFLDVSAQFRSLFLMGREVFLVLLVGGTLVGVALAVPAYGATLWAVRRHRKRLARKGRHARHLFRRQGVRNPPREAKRGGDGKGG